MKKKDLYKLAPKLSEISLKKSGFKIPTNYFDTIEDAIFAELKAEKFQNKTTEKAFKTPENYFNSLEDIIITKLKAEVIQLGNDNESSNEIPKDYFKAVEETILTNIKTTPKVFSLKSRFAKFIIPIAVAASLLLIVTLNINSNQDSISFDSLTSTDLENWIENGNIDIDALTMASIYSDIELNNDSYTSSISDEEVIDYLNNEDLELIIYEN